MFQAPAGCLNTVFDEIAYALRNLKMEEHDIATRIENIAGLLEFQNEDLLSRSPFHLSEGQKRKVAIASILVCYTIGRA